MRAHVGSCEGVPEEFRTLAEGWAEAAKVHDTKVSHKRKQPGSTSTPKSAAAHQVDPALSGSASQPMGASTSVVAPVPTHGWSQEPLAGLLSGESGQIAPASQPAERPNGSHAQAGQNKRQKTAAKVDHDKDAEQLTERQYHPQPQTQTPVVHRPR